MKKIEITNKITEYLTKSPISLTDLLNKTLKLDSYEKYVQEISLVKKVFDKDIPQYADEANKWLEKMDSFIEDCNNSNDLSNYISSYLRTKICSSNYNYQITPKFVSPNNLSGTPEQSVQALKQVYSELGEDQLGNYIQLIKNPSNLSSFLTDTKKQKAAMHYILFATNHHSTSKLRRNQTAQSLYNLTSEHIHDSLKEISAYKDDYISFMNQEKDNYTTWFNETSAYAAKTLETNQQNYNQFIEDGEARLKNIEKTYAEKLKVEKPAKYMETESTKYKKNSFYWALGTAALSVVLIILLGIVLDPKIEIQDKVFTLQIFSGNMTIYNQIIVLAIITLVIYLLKLFVKMTISTKHLAEEYYQKHVLTYFYLSLVMDGTLTDEQTNIILGTLFAKADTGLIKNDSSGEVEALQRILFSMKSPS